VAVVTLLLCQHALGVLPTAGGRKKEKMATGGGRNEEIVLACPVEDGDCRQLLSTTLKVG
jgi:hypothetical protein